MRTATVNRTVSQRHRRRFSRCISSGLPFLTALGTDTPPSLRLQLFPIPGFKTTAQRAAEREARQAAAVAEPSPTPADHTPSSHYQQQSGEDDIKLQGK
jgi:hypothetical protein